MKTKRLRLRLVSLAIVALPLSVWALDIRIPHPKKVVREVRGTVHRVARDVEGAGRQVIRSVTHGQRPAPRNRAGSSPSSVVRPAPGSPPQESGAENSVSKINESNSTSAAAVSSSPASVQPTVRPFDPMALPDTHFGPQATSRPATSSTLPPDEAPFARPVPGKKGIVYTPGSDETPESMVDVRDFAPGTLVKNPRTGVLFRVP